MKKIFLYLVIGIIFLAIPVTVILVNRNQELRKRAAPASTIAFFPPSQTVNEGQSFSLDVKLDTATNQVGLVQIRVVYDPAFLEAVDITNNPEFAPTIQVSKKIDPNGKVSISVGAKDTLHPIIGSGSVATLSMKAIKSSATPITIKFTSTPDTQANAIGEDANDVLIGRSQASITILNADGTPSTNIGASLTNTNNSTSSAAIPSPTPTPLPLTLTPTLAASQSAAATQSALLITSITKDEEIQTRTPVIQGKGIPGTTVTITIHSETQTVVVTVDANGNWSYTPTTPLDSGPHSVTALYTDPNTGVTQSKTQTFVVVPEGIGGGATESGMPVSGNVNTTIILMMVGILFIVTGLVIPTMIPSYD